MKTSSGKDRPRDMTYCVNQKCILKEQCARSIIHYDFDSGYVISKSECDPVYEDCLLEDFFDKKKKKV